MQQNGQESLGNVGRDLEMDWIGLGGQLKGLPRGGIAVLGEGGYRKSSALDGGGGLKQVIGGWMWLLL